MSWFPCCCCRLCAWCAGGFARNEWQVDVAGFANKVPEECADCADLNGQYVLQIALPFVGPGSPCGWEHALDPSSCGATKIRLTVGAMGIFVMFLDANGDVLFSANKFYNDPPDCLNLADEDLGPVTETLGIDLCDVSGATIKATALCPCSA